MGRKSISSECGPQSTIAAMIRRVALASFLVLVLSAANVLAAAKTVTISNAAFSPNSIQVAMGGSVQWKNATAKKQTVVSDAPFLWGTLTVKPHKSKSLVFQQAGSFVYHDSLKAGLKGTVQVPMTADAVDITLGSQVMLKLGTTPVSGPAWHEVVARVNGGAWISAATTGGTSTGYQPPSAGTWQLETRLHQALSGWNTGWSPILTITVE